MIRVGIYGYGNLGRGVEAAVTRAQDMTLVGIFTRRNPSDVVTVTETPVFSSGDAVLHKDDIDVMIVCGGSASDLPVMTPALALHFNVVDSFDTHAKIHCHFDAVDNAAKDGGHAAIISVGWDPGLFSVNRLIAEAALPDGVTYTFWGKGVSQGHSDAIRRIEGVADARQYTVPITEALDSVRRGDAPVLDSTAMHRRVCYVVAKEGAELDRIAHEIKTMPNYFEGYETEVHFISAEEMKRDHSCLPHGGFVIRTGTTGYDEEHQHRIEYSLKLDSNPEFTASVLCAYARAAYRRFLSGTVGCFTPFDIAPAELSQHDSAWLRSHIL